MIKVIVVDDSAIIRKVFKKSLSEDKQINVVGTAPDPFVARDLIVKLKPDIITLDIEMPKMDGITFLKKLMHYYPLPVIVVSSLTYRGGERALEAIENGAVDVMCKPGSSYASNIMTKELIEKIKAVAKVDIQKHINLQKKPQSGIKNKSLSKYSNKVIAIGASTGGTNALDIVLRKMPPDSPGIIITQHMPGLFTKSFAERLNYNSKIHVKEAVDGDLVKPGTALVAEGTKHLLLRKKEANYYVQLKDGPPVNRHKPSVDVMFISTAKTASINSIGVLLTGMGADGAKGLYEMKRMGARTIAQDEKSCIVFGMPKVAIDMGAADKVVNLKNIPEEIINMIESK